MRFSKDYCPRPPYGRGRARPGRKYRMSENALAQRRRNLRTCRERGHLWRGYPVANAPLDAINGELTSEFAAQRIKQGKQIATVNSSLRVLRRVLNLAVEWGVITVAPKLKVLSGERRRERVVTAEEEAKYVTVASEPLGSIATVLADTGMRPEESSGCAGSM